MAQCRRIMLEEDAHPMTNTRARLHPKSREKLDEFQNEYEEMAAFKEMPTRLLDRFEYPRPGSDPGLVIVFNQKFFSGNTERLGTNRDVNEIIQTFSRLGYNIRQQHIFNDLSRSEILEKLQYLSEQDHSDINCLIVFFLSHGGNNNIMDVKDGVINVDDFCKRFGENECPTLMNKPKFFIFQCCKGNLDSDTTTLKGDILPPQFFTKRLQPDMLIAFATVEGSISLRHIQKGSWFIQELCKTFTAYGRRDDVMSLLTRTSKIIANYYYNEKESLENNERTRIITKQMPLMISTLTRKFFLTRSKDRLFTLDMLENQKRFQNQMEDICKKVDVLCEAMESDKVKK